MCTRGEHIREGCLFRTMSGLTKIRIINQHIFLQKLLLKLGFVVRLS